MSNPFIDALPEDVRAAAVVAFNRAADVGEWGTGEPYGIIGAAIMAHATEAYGQALRVAAEAVEKHDKEGRNFIPGSLWDTLSREAAARIRDLNKGPGTPWPSFQARVRPWMTVCFGEEIAADKLERADRHIEEVLELLQSVDYPRDRVIALIDYVYGRPKGDTHQEIGGVMTTLAAFCLAHRLDMHEAADAELARVWTKVDKIRAKQAAKPVGSALPIATTAAPAATIDDSMVDRLCRSRYSAFDDWSEELRTEERYRMKAALNAALGES
jgi:hypothetical protein